MEKIINILGWIAKRLKEPSTQAGLASIGALIHVNIDPGIYQQSVDVFMGITGLLSIVLKEKGS